MRITASWRYPPALSYPPGASGETDGRTCWGPTGFTILFSRAFFLSLDAVVAILFSFPPQCPFNLSRRPRLPFSTMVSNKGTILITGANGGLGKALVSQVLSSPELSQHHGLYTVRDETSSSSSALLSILRNAPSSHTYDMVSLNLTKPTSVREATESISRREMETHFPRHRRQRHRFSRQGIVEHKQGRSVMAQWIQTLWCQQAVRSDDDRRASTSAQRRYPAE